VSREINVIAHQLARNTHARVRRERRRVVGAFHDHTIMGDAATDRKQFQCVGIVTDQFAQQAPTLVVVLSSPVTDSHIPLWEQELSAGAAAMNLLHAVTAMGFAGGWLTAWPAYNDTVRDAFGKAPERIAGFVFIGTPGKPVEERPRPDYGSSVSVWGGPPS